MLHRFLNKFWAIGLIFAIWLVFSSPYLIQSKVPFPGDDQRYAYSPWDSYVIKGPIKNPAMTDVITQLYPWKIFSIASLKHGIIPFWNPYSFSGTPHLANYQSAVLSPLNGLFYLFPFIDAWSLIILMQPLLAGIFMYLFMRSLKVSNCGAVLSSIGFMFCGFMTVWLAWGTLDYAILYLPLALFSIERFFSQKKRGNLLILVASVALSFFSGHFQMSLYFYAVTIFYTVYKYITLRNKSAFFITMLYLFFGLLIAMPQILPSIQLYNQSLRSSIFQKNESIPWNYIVTLLAPDFFGNPVTRNDWFGHYAEWNIYIGILPLMFSVYAVFRKQTDIVYFFLLLCLIGVLFAFSTPFLDAVIALHIPVLSTSAASRIIIVSSFSLLVLAGLGYDYVTKDILARRISYGIYVLVGFFIAISTLWLLVLAKIGMPSDKIIIARQNLYMPTLLFLLIFLTAGGIYIVRLQKKFITIAMFLFVLIAMFDSFRFSGKWLPFTPKMDVFAQTPVTSSFHPENTYNRVLGNYGAEMSMPFFYPSVEGYDAVYLKRYGEFIHYINTGVLGESEKSLVNLSKNAPFTWMAMNLMNVTNIIVKKSDGKADWVFHYWDHFSDMVPVYEDNSFLVLKNIRAFPRVFLAGKYSVEHDPHAILSAMFQMNKNLHSELILEKNPSIPFSENPGVAKVILYEPNKVTIAARANHPSLLFLSDNYYPEWEAFIDGKNTAILRADYTFRSVVVPKGEHIITFRYQPMYFLVGLWLGMCGLLCSLVTFARIKGH